MIRGTTAQFKFNLPYQLKDIRDAQITFWQKGDSFSAAHSLDIVKYRIDCVGRSGDKAVYVSLNPEETARFSDKKHGYVQFRGVATDFTVFASKQESFIVYPCVNDDPIGEIPPPEDDNNDGWVVIDSGVIGRLSG